MTSLEQVRQAIRQAARECTTASHGSHPLTQSAILARTATTLHTVSDRLHQAALADGTQVDTDLTLDLILSRVLVEDRRGDPWAALDAALEAVGYLKSKRAEEVAA